MAGLPITVSEIVRLNVGGVRFSTSRETLTWIPDQFFSSMLSGRISTLKDEEGAIFIDRDPDMFRLVLSYLRTKDIDLKGIDIRRLRHEAEFYGINPLVRRLLLCERLSEPSCGGILFHGTIPAPDLPGIEVPITQEIPNVPNDRQHGGLRMPDRQAAADRAALPGGPAAPDRPVAPDQPAVPDRPAVPNRAERVDRRVSDSSTCSVDPPSRPGQHRHSTQSLQTGQTGVLHRAMLSGCHSPTRVTIIKGHFNWLVAAYTHHVCLYKLKDSVGWHLTWTSNYIEDTIDRIAVNAKVSYTLAEYWRLVAAASGTSVRLWSIPDRANPSGPIPVGGPPADVMLGHHGVREVGVFELGNYLEHLFFSGSQLVALSPQGRVGVWHAMTHNWQVQEVAGICSYDTAASFLLLGCENGSIYYIDMQKFPLRMKDNDLLLTEIYKDPAGEPVTALSFYLTPKTSLATGNWLEIAYGTEQGKVHVIVQHPETQMAGPQLFHTFTSHTCPISKVMLSEKHLVSVCSDYSHVRSWSITRFRGMISTQPGSLPLTSFNVASLEYMQPVVQHSVGNDIGPFGEKDDTQIFIQKLVPDTDTVFVRMAATGQRVCTIKSLDGSEITSFIVHECEGSTRMGSRPRRYLFTGHSHGGLQIWDLSTALDRFTKGETCTGEEGAPSTEELLSQLDMCDLTNSCTPTPSVSPSPSLLSAAFSPRAYSPAKQQTTPERSRRHLPPDTRHLATERHLIPPEPVAARLRAEARSRVRDEAPC